jgi:hypothetical protein
VLRRDAYPGDVEFFWLGSRHGRVLASSPADLEERRQRRAGTEEGLEAKTDRADRFPVRAFNCTTAGAGAQIGLVVRSAAWKVFARANAARRWSSFCFRRSSRLFRDATGLGAEREIYFPKTDRDFIWTPFFSSLSPGVFRYVFAEFLQKNRTVQACERTMIGIKSHQSFNAGESSDLSRRGARTPSRKISHWRDRLDQSTRPLRSARS